MIITTAMMIAKGAVTYQTDILDAVLNGSLDTSNLGQATTGAGAGLDLTWIAKKFGSNPSLAAQIADAKKTAKDAATTTVNDAIATYDGLKAGYDTALLDYLPEPIPPDPATIKDAAVRKASEEVDGAAATAEATTFVSVMAV